MFVVDKEAKMRSLFVMPKGQLILKCPFGVFKPPKRPGFLP